MSKHTVTKVLLDVLQDLWRIWAIVSHQSTRADDIFISNKTKGVHILSDLLYLYMLYMQFSGRSLVLTNVPQLRRILAARSKTCVYQLRYAETGSLNILLIRTAKCNHIVCDTRCHVRIHKFFSFPSTSIHSRHRYVNHKNETLHAPDLQKDLKKPQPRIIILPQNCAYWLFHQHHSG